jgi:transcriptional antiterminator NusG
MSHNSMETSEEFRTAEDEESAAVDASPDAAADSSDAPVDEAGPAEEDASAVADTSAAESDDGEAEGEPEAEPEAEDELDEETIDVVVSQDEETGDAIVEVSQVVEVVDDQGEVSGLAEITETAEVDESGEVTEIAETVDVVSIDEEGTVTEVVDTLVANEEGVTEVVDTVVEDDEGTTEVVAIDEDADGVIDAVAVSVDVDGDGVPDAVAMAIDEDGDGTPDVAMVAVDVDGDGVADVVEVVELDESEEESTADEADAEGDAAPAEAAAAPAAAAAAEPADGARARDPFGGPGDWYVVHTYAGYENKVKANLLSRIHSMQMEDKIFNVHIPMEDVLEIKGGKRQVVQRKVFPGYLLVKMFYDNDSWYVVRNTPGVTGFVSSGTGTKPTPLSKREVEKILAVKQEAEAKPQFRLEFEEGDTVRIVSGPFADFNGTVSEINVDQSKLKVLVSIFDRETPVELGFDQVAKV